MVPDALAGELARALLVLDALDLLREGAGRAVLVDLGHGVAQEDARDERVVPRDLLRRREHLGRVDDPAVFPGREALLLLALEELEVLLELDQLGVDLEGAREDRAAVGFLALPLEEVAQPLEQPFVLGRDHERLAQGLLGDVELTHGLLVRREGAQDLHVPRRQRRGLLEELDRAVEAPHALGDLRLLEERTGVALVERDQLVEVDPALVRLAALGGLAQEASHERGRGLGLGGLGQLAEPPRRDRRETLGVLELQRHELGVEEAGVGLERLADQLARPRAVAERLEVVGREQPGRLRVVGLELESLLERLTPLVLFFIDRKLGVGHGRVAVEDLEVRIARLDLAGFFEGLAVEVLVLVVRLLREVEVAEVKASERVLGVGLAPRLEPGDRTTVGVELLATDLGLLRGGDLVGRRPANSRDRAALGRRHAAAERPGAGLIADFEEDFVPALLEPDPHVRLVETQRTALVFAVDERAIDPDLERLFRADPERDLGVGVRVEVGDRIGESLQLRPEHGREVDLAPERIRDRDRTPRDLALLTLERRLGVERSGLDVVLVAEARAALVVERADDVPLGGESESGERLVGLVTLAQRTELLELVPRDHVLDVGRQRGRAERVEEPGASLGVAELAPEERAAAEKELHPRGPGGVERRGLGGPVRERGRGGLERRLELLHALAELALTLERQTLALEPGRLGQLVGSRHGSGLGRGRLVRGRGGRLVRGRGGRLVRLGGRGRGAGLAHDRERRRLLDPLLARAGVDHELGAGVLDDPPLDLGAVAQRDRVGERRREQQDGPEQQGDSERRPCQLALHGDLSV